MRRDTRERRATSAIAVIGGSEPDTTSPKGRGHGANGAQTARGTLHGTFAVTLLNGAARGAQLAFLLAVGNVYGISGTTDAVFFLYSPLTVIMTVSASIAEVVVMPALHRIASEPAASALLKSLARRGVLASLALSGLALLAASVLVPGTSLWTPLILLPVPALAAVSALLAGVLNARGTHAHAVAGPLYGAAAAMASLLALPLSAASLAATLLAFELGRLTGLALHVLPMSRADDGRDERTQETYRWAMGAARWQALGALLVGVSPFVDLLFARTLGTGAITSVEYASRLSALVPVLFSGKILLTYAWMSREAARGSLRHRDVHLRAVRIFVWGLIVTAAAVALSGPIISLAYASAQMSDTARAELALLLACYLSGTASFVTGVLYVRALSAHGRSDVLARIAGLHLVLNTALNALLIGPLGVFGIGLATALTYTLTLAVFVYAFRRSCPEAGTS